MTVNYTWGDAQELIKQIKRLDPTISCENWRDYRFSVDCRKGRFWLVACQPRTDYQDAIWRSAQEVVDMINGKKRIHSSATPDSDSSEFFKGVSSQD